VAAVSAFWLFLGVLFLEEGVKGFFLGGIITEKQETSRKNRKLRHDYACKKVARLGCSRTHDSAFEPILSSPSP